MPPPTEACPFAACRRTGVTGADVGARRRVAVVAVRTIEARSLLPLAGPYRKTPSPLYLGSLSYPRLGRAEGSEGLGIYEVTIVGGGPTGLMVAGELALAGVDVEIIERRLTPNLIGSRARGFHSRTIEILDQGGIVDRFLAAGQAAQG